MFTFNRLVTPTLRRSDGIDFSLEWMMDMKALGRGDEVEMLMQSPSTTGVGFVKIFEGGAIHFYDNSGNEVFPKSNMNVSIPESILSQLKAKNL